MARNAESIASCNAEKQANAIQIYHHALFAWLVSWMVVGFHHDFFSQMFAHTYTHTLSLTIPILNLASTIN